MSGLHGDRKRKAHGLTMDETKRKSSHFANFIKELVFFNTSRPAAKVTL